MNPLRPFVIACLAFLLAPVSTPSALANEPPCIALGHEAVHCLGDGAYSYTLTVTNFSALTVGHLAFLDLPGGATAAPPIVSLTNHLTTGQSATVSILLSNVSPAELCFRVAAHTPDFNECCVVDHCVTIAPEPPVRLHISLARQPREVVMCWLQTCHDYALESTGSLSPPRRWEPVDAPVVSAGGTNCVTAPARPGQRFFRLRRR